jgi:hypothetical protein
VLGLAVVAFAPRMPAAASKLAVLANRIELPWDPTLQPGPALTPLDRGATLAAPMDAAPMDAAPMDAASISATPMAAAAMNAAPVDATPVDAAPPMDPAAAVGSPAESTAEPPNQEVVEPVTKRSSEVARSSMPQPTDAPADQSATSSESRASEAVPESREPSLTPEEIERRKQRYEQWLESEGLQRIR